MGRDEFREEVSQGKQADFHDSGEKNHLKFHRRGRREKREIRMARVRSALTVVLSQEI
jgi:RIO-like serine/threonine protein kinase